MRSCDRQKIIPNLWFNRCAKEAVDYYLAVFKESKLISTSYYPSEGLEDFQKDFAGQVLTIEFELFDQKFVAINAGDDFKFSEAVSFMIPCKDQEEIDYYWDKLSHVPAFEQCGWCKDKYGLSWQINPENMTELMKNPNSFSVMMRQKKIVIADYID